MTHFQTPPQIAPVLIRLLKGVVYRDHQEQQWQSLIDFQAAVHDYFTVIGLELIIDESEGYAFLRQSELEREDIEDSEQQTLPRLVQRRPLSYPVSLLCILLRKRLVEQDASGGETRVILSRDQIIDIMRVYLPGKGNEAKSIDQISRHINKVIEYGFLRRLKGQEDQFEVRRIIKALITADLLVELDHKLAQYIEYIETAADE